MHRIVRKIKENMPGAGAFHHLDIDEFQSLVETVKKSAEKTVNLVLENGHALEGVCEKKDVAKTH